MTIPGHMSLQMGYPEWNRRLLRYYFGAEPSGPDWHRPVTHLHVTVEDLHQTAGNPAISPSDVRASFLAMFASEHRGRNFSTVAKDSGDWRPQAYDEPPFFVHLVVSCLVATDFESEDAYSTRLNEACANGMQNTTEALPPLWNQLRDWLENARQRGESYRSLVLPARRERGWTNIGYSLDLAFPRRVDRDELRAVLEKQQLLGREPTITGVLVALEGRGSRFSAQFNEVFLDFKRTVEHGKPRWNHAFWSAVRDACMASSEVAPVEVQLLITPDHTGFRPYLVARTEEDASRLGFEATASPMLDEWPFAIHRGNDYEEPVRALLDGRITVSQIASCVQNGVLGFTPLEEDVWAWTPSSRLRHRSLSMKMRQSCSEFSDDSPWS